MKQNGSGERRISDASPHLLDLDQLRASLTRRTGCADDAADIVQESFVRLAQRESRTIANPAGYLRRIAHNLLVDRIRERRSLSIGPLTDTIVFDAPSAERALVARDRLQRVLAVADRLPTRCREVFVLRKLEGLEQQEIASRLGISLNMVQKHLRKALGDIMATLGDDF